MSFQSCMTIFHISVYLDVNVNQNCLVTDIDQNIFYISQQKESHTGLEWREDE